MKIPKRPTEKTEYKLKLDESVSFTLKPLNNAQYDEVTDLLASEKKASALRLACTHGVIGWSLEDAFSKQAVSELPPEWAYEIGGEVISISSLTEQQKN